jgi:hypothetical protein
MKFTQDKIKAVNKNLSDKKANNRIKLEDCISGVSAVRDMGNMRWAICTVEDIKETIEELTMLKEAIEEETGVVL